MHRPRFVPPIVLALLILPCLVAAPAWGWHNPGYTLHWPGTTVYGLATDGHRTIIGLGQPSHLYDPSGRDLGQFGANLGPEEPLYASTAVGVSPTTGHLIVADISATIDRRILELDATGHFVRRVPIPVQYLEDNQYFYRGIAVDAQENIYLADTDHGRVLVFAADGTLLHTWGAQGSGPDQLDHPSRLLFDGGGNLLVADRYNHRIQKISPTAGLTLFFQKPDVRAIDFGFDHFGNLYVLSEDYGVWAFDANGAELGHWNNYGTNLQLNYPRLLVVDSDDNIYVSEATSPLFIVKYDPRVVTDPPSGHYPPKIVLSALPVVTGGDACERGRVEAIEDAHVSAELARAGVGPYYYVYLLMARGEGSDLAGLQCGITYQSGAAAGQQDGQRLDIFDWHLCADLQFPTPAGLPAGAPDWPGPGSGNLITWDPLNNCQRRNTVVAGYFYVGAYGTDALRVTARPVDGFGKVAYCTGAEHNLMESDLGSVSFSAGAHTLGCNPVLHNCANPVPVRATTWSAIKGMFRDS